MFHFHSNTYSVYTTAGYNMTQDDCCFTEANSSEITCNVTIYLPPSMVGESRLTLELVSTDYNLVCSQSQLNMTIENTGAGVYTAEEHACLACIIYCMYKHNNNITIVIHLWVYYYNYFSL